MRPEKKLLASIVVLGLLSTGSSDAQTNLAPNAGFEQTAQGNPPCRYTWENDGPCAPEYAVQQYPDEAFVAELLTLNGDNVFAVNVLRGDVAPNSGNPAVNLKYTLAGVSPGEVYAFSVAVRTDALRFGTSLRATPKGDGGAIISSRVSQDGPRQTAPWQRVGLELEVPEGANAIDFVIYVSGALGSCGEDCGMAYFDDIEITQVDNLAPNASLSATASGDPPCRYTWENDGPCAPEYFVQQYPDEAFSAEIQSRSGSNVFAVDVLHDDLAPSSGDPKVSFKYTLSGVVPGEVYSFSTSVETDALQFETSLRATPKGAAGAIIEARVSEDGPDQTTPWQRFGLEVAVPEGATAIDFVIYVSGVLGGCGGGPCGSAYFDDLSITRVLSHPFSNVCPDGQYLDWAHTENDCQELQVDLSQLAAQGVDCDLEALHWSPSRGLSTFDSARVFTATDTYVGFKPGAFEAAFSAGGLRDDRFTVAGCTEADLQDALAAAEANGGGTVNLPACEIAIDSRVEVPTNTIVQGAGIGRTILVPGDPWNSNRIFFLEEVHDIVIRDLTVDVMDNPGHNQTSNNEGGSSFGFLLKEVDNVLIERVEAKDATLVAFDWEASLNFTLRNSVAAGSETGQHRGFTASDCQLEETDEMVVTLDDCLTNIEHKFGEGLALDWYWVANHAIYSNLVMGNKSSGVNSHGLLAEIAGNRIIGNGQGSKFSQARYFWLHDNLYQGSREDLIRLQTPWRDFRQSKNLLIYRNRFINNGSSYSDSTGTPELLVFTFPNQPSDFGPGMYLIDNDFAGNQGRLLGLFADPLCEGTDEALDFPPWVPGMNLDHIADWHIRYNFDPDLLPAADAICQLSNVNTIFPIEVGCLD